MIHVSKLAPVAVFLALVWGCSGAPTESGVAGSKNLVGLTTEEVGTLCDFAAAQFGGYGSPKECDNGPQQPKRLVERSSNRASCIADGQQQIDAMKKSGGACEATVHDYELYWHLEAQCVGSLEEGEAAVRLDQCGVLGPFNNPFGPSN